MTEAQPEPMQREAPAWSDDEALKRYLQDRDLPCPVCRYNLRNLGSARCPECGHRLRLRVRLSEPHLHAWIALVVTACAGAGIGILFTALVIKEGLPDWSQPRRGLLAATIFYFIGNVPLAVLVVWLRRRLLRLPRGSQWKITVGLMVLSSALMVLFFALID